VKTKDKLSGTRLVIGANRQVLADDKNLCRQITNWLMAKKCNTRLVIHQHLVLPPAARQFYARARA